MRIEQVRVSDAIPYFKDKVRRRFGLREYDNPNEPAVFWGCDRTLGGMKVIAEHKTDCVLVWAGTDALRMRGEPNLYESMRLPHIHHVAQSSFIADDLKYLGIPHVQVPVNCAEPSVFRPRPLGTYIYVYAPRPQESPNKYGAEIVDELRANKTLPFIVTSSCRTYAREKMPDIYGQSFVGLRLTAHDGMSHTVSEMGLMGRRCIWNGNSPNAIPYRDAKDVLELIDAEYRNPPDPYVVSEEMRAFLDVGDDWLNIDWYVGSAENGTADHGGAGDFGDPAPHLLSSGCEA